MHRSETPSKTIPSSFALDSAFNEGVEAAARLTQIAVIFETRKNAELIDSICSNSIKSLRRPIDRGT